MILVISAAFGSALRLDAAGGQPRIEPIAEPPDAQILSSHDVDELPLNPVWKRGPEVVREKDVSGSTLGSLVRKFAEHPARMQLQIRRVPSELMHQIDVANGHRLWGLRPSATYTWAEQRSSLAKAGRLNSWCILARDKWQCAGERYEEVLRKSPPFDTALSLENWPRHLRVYAEGNSYFAELITQVACESNAEVWKFVQGNSLLASAPSSNATVLLFDNHPYWMCSPKSAISLLKDIGYTPDVVVLGPVNSGLPGDKAACANPVDQEARKRAWASAFSSSKIVDRAFGTGKEEVPGTELLLPTECKADFANCGTGPGHQCFPGPMSANAEALVRDIIGPESS